MKEGGWRTGPRNFFLVSLGRLPEGLIVSLVFLSSGFLLYLKNMVDIRQGN
jgi:hypothetical protein